MTSILYNYENALVLYIWNRVRWPYIVVDRDIFPLNIHVHIKIQRNFYDYLSYTLSKQAIFRQNKFEIRMILGEIFITFFSSTQTLNVISDTTFITCGFIMNPVVRNTTVP